jgi:hypothetical protein
MASKAGSVAGLLVSAGFLNRRLTVFAAPALIEVPGSQGGAPESTHTRGNSPSGAILCRVALAHFLGLGSLARAFVPANEAAGMLILRYFFNSDLAYLLLAISRLSALSASLWLGASWEVCCYCRTSSSCPASGCSRQLSSLTRSYTV